MIRLYTKNKKLYIIYIMRHNIEATRKAGKLELKLRKA